MENLPADRIQTKSSAKGRARRRRGNCEACAGSLDAAVTRELFCRADGTKVRQGLLKRCVWRLVKLSTPGRSRQAFSRESVGPQIGLDTNNVPPDVFRLLAFSRWLLSLNFLLTKRMHSQASVRRGSYGQTSLLASASPRKMLRDVA